MRINWGVGYVTSRRARWRWLALVVSASLAVPACILLQDTSPLPPLDVMEDGFVDDTEVGADVPDEHGSTNACGGTASLAQTVGATCGACGQGVVLCDGIDATRCVGDPADAGASCAPPAILGESCGRCGGVWRLEPGGADAYCSEDTTNACGECQSLALDATVQPGFVCEAVADDGMEEGVWSCVGPNTLSCVLPHQNACGGAASLPEDAVPGLPCGACGMGIWTCTDEDTVVCDSPEPGVDEDGEGYGVNACGGCGPLAAAPGSACGDAEEGGAPLACASSTWTCRDGLVQCTRSGANACGGCAALEGAPGDACGEGGRWACAGPERVACGDTQGTNQCGGTSTLSGDVGAPCGACGGGAWACAGPDAMACVGDRTNACGGCDDTANVLGVPCAWGRWAWGCAGEGTDQTLRCLPTGASNPCGGAVSMPTAPGESCGACDHGRYVCRNRDRIFCQEDPERAPRQYWIDADGDGYGAQGSEPRTLCAPEAGWVDNDLDCDDDDPEVHPGMEETPGDGVDRNCDGRQLCFVDADGDGVLPDDPDVVESLNLDCDGPFEADENAPRGDCDDNDPLVSPLHDPLCLNCRIDEWPDGACMAFRGLVLNEVVVGPDTWSVELVNVTDDTVVLPVTAQLRAERHPEAMAAETFTITPVVVTLAAGDHVAFTFQDVPTVWTSPLADGGTLDLWLWIPGQGLQDRALLEVAPGAPQPAFYCRLPDGLGPWSVCDEATLNAPNE